MKKKSAPTAARTSTPAEITITVNQFKDVLSPEAGDPGTRCGMHMKRRHRHVTVKDNTILVWKPGATIRFTIVPAPGDKEKYYPAGITYVREGATSTSDRQRLGLLNFPQGRTRVDGQTLTFTDSYRDKAKKIRYKFSVLIQRGSDGKIGLIDPDIVHEDEH